MKTILINTADSLLGTTVAQALQRTGMQPRGGLRLLGMAERPLAQPGPWTAVHTPPVAGHALTDFLRDEQVNVVVQVDVAGEEQPVRDYEAALQQHVLGTMLLLGACVAAGVQRVVLRSSTLVYGAHARQPAFISEDHALSRSGQTRLLRNYVEVDTFAQTFARKHPGLEIVVLRCAGLVGDGIWSPLTHYLTQPHPRMLLGFNPRMQVLHPDDAAHGFALAALGSATGAYNLAANEPLKLLQLIRLAGQQPVVLPESLLTVAGAFGYQRSILGAWPFGQGFLRYACVADTRRAQRELYWQPAHAAKASVRTLARQRELTNPPGQPNYAH